MSLATLAPPAFPSLADVVDSTAAACGSWVLAERAGSVMHHGVGAGPCPPDVMEALLTKRVEALRRGVTWVPELGRLRGRSAEADVAAADLGASWSVWLVGGDVDEGLHWAEALCHATRDDEVIHDPFVHEQLQPKLRGWGPPLPFRCSC